MSKKQYPPRIPRRAFGFRTQELRNGTVPRGAWWAKEWLSAIDAMRLGARTGRGKNYAERGQVTRLVAEGTHVEATVTGSRNDPYEVKIDFSPICETAADGADLFGAMTLARTLAGEMPLGVTEVFSQHRLLPWPKLERDHFWCSCPDWSKPCKHIVAVLYLLGDVIVREPSLLLKLRGVTWPGCGENRALPLWKGEEKFRDRLDRIYRLTGAKE